MRRSFVQLAKRVFLVPVMESILRRLIAGRDYPSLLTRLAPTHQQYARGTLRNIRVNGLNFRVDISEHNGWWVFWGFSHLSRRRLYALAREGDVVFDVGANLGEVTLNIARLVGEKGRVLAFEPFDQTYENLDQNVRLNTLTNIELFHRAISDSQGLVRIAPVDERNSGMNRVTTEAVGPTAITIETTTLDNIVDQRKLSHVDLIKVDVEGFEMHVLRGAHKTLEKFRPKLFVEIDDDNLRAQGSSANEVLKNLAAYGYRFSHAETLAVVRPDDDLRCQHFDVIALLPHEPALHNISNTD